MDCGVDLEPRNSAVLDHLDYVRGLSSGHRIVATNNTVAAESVLGAFDGQVCLPAVLCVPILIWTQQHTSSSCIKEQKWKYSACVCISVCTSQHTVCTEFCSMSV